MTRRRQVDGCGIKVNAVTPKGGAVVLNAEHGVWLSYAVATVGAEPPREVMYTGIKLKNGKGVQIMIDRETGKLVVDVIDKSGTNGGKEVFNQVI